MSRIWKSRQASAIRRQRKADIDFKKMIHHKNHKRTKVTEEVPPSFLCAGGHFVFFVVNHFLEFCS